MCANRKACAKAWAFPEACSYIHIVLDKSSDSFSHIIVGTENFFFFLFPSVIDKKWFPEKPRSRGVENTHFTLNPGTETPKCDGAVRARAITDALAEALWRQTCLVKGTYWSVRAMFRRCFWDILEVEHCHHVIIDPKEVVKGWFPQLLLFHFRRCRFS